MSIHQAKGLEFPVVIVPDLGADQRSMQIRAAVWHRSLGAVANVGVATALFERDYVWWGAGLAGVLVGSVWNYALSSRFVWGRF